MIYVFDRHETFLALLQNDNKESCPYWGANVREVLGGEYTFTFTVPYDHPDSIHLQELGYVAFQDYERNYQLFIITEVEEIHSGELVKRVTCEHASIEMLDEHIEDLYIDRKQTNFALDRILERSRWNAGHVELTSTHTLTVRNKTVREALSTFSSRWGVELKFRVQIIGNRIAYRYVDVYVHRGNDTGKRFEFRKDIQEITRTVLADGVKTALYGLGADPSQNFDMEDISTMAEGEERITFKEIEWSTQNGDPIDKPMGQSWIGLESAKEIYGYQTNQNVTIVSIPESTSTKIGSESYARWQIEVPFEVGETYTVESTVKVIEGATNEIAVFPYTEGENVRVPIINGTITHTFTVTSPNTTSLLLYHGVGGQTAGNTIAFSNTRIYKTNVYEKNHRYGVYQNTQVNDPEELLRETYQALLNMSVPKIQYSVKVVDLQKILGFENEMVNLGDIVAIVDSDLDLRLQARVIEYNYDLTLPEQSQVVLGNFLPKITNQFEQIETMVDEAVRNSQVSLPDDLLREGDIIRTEWLEGLIDTARNRVEAGNGSVQITEDNGILIVDDPENPQQAIRLLAGQIAFANNRDPVTGLFNWRSFGTAEGWISDLVNTGRLTFNSSSGGTLQLGGLNNVEGILSVIDEEGFETVRLEGNYGGFERINIDQLMSTKNVVFKTSGYSENLVENTIHYFVDPNDGNDEWEGTFEKPLARIQEALDRLPKYLEHDVLIQFVPAYLQDTEIVIEGFYGRGKLVIQRYPFKFRYFRDYANGSTSNPASHWVEIMPKNKDGNRIVPHYVVDYKGREETYPNDELIKVINGNTHHNDYWDGGYSNDGKPNWIAIYTGGLYTDIIDEVVVWHYHSGGRTYYETKTEFAEELVDNDVEKSRWFTIFDSAREGEYSEQTNGHVMSVSRAYFKGKMDVRNNGIDLEIRDMFIDGSGLGSISNTFWISRSTYCLLMNCVLFGSKDILYTIYNNGALLRLRDCEVNTAKTSGIMSAYGAHTEIMNVVGAGFPYGHYAYYGTIMGSGNGLLGSSTNTRNTNGQIEGSWTHKGGKYSPIRIVNRSGSWKNTSSAYYSYPHGIWGKDTNEPAQGKYNSYGAYAGYWFWGNTIRNAVYKKKIKKVRVWVMRKNSGNGYDAPVDIVVRTHGFASRPSDSVKPQFSSDAYTIPLNRGEGKWIDATARFKDQFENGTAYGICVYTTNHTNRHYARMHYSARIEITWEEEQVG